MISRETEQLLHETFMEARKLRHQIIGTEHLLSHLLNDPKVRAWLDGKGVDVTRLKAALSERLEAAEKFEIDEEVDTQPTVEFQRTIQRAILRATSSQTRSEVDNLDVLHALLASRKPLPAELGLSGLGATDSKAKDH